MATDLNLFRKKKVLADDPEDAEFGRQGENCPWGMASDASSRLNSHRNQKSRTLLAVVLRLGQVLELAGKPSRDVRLPRTEHVGPRLVRETVHPS